MLWLLLSAGAVILIAAGLLLYGHMGQKQHKPPVTDRVTIPVKPLQMKVLAVIIDDIGHNHPAAYPFINMDLPVALAFLPGRPFSRELAAEAASRGKTILLHLPMEPEGYPGVDPGPGAILVSQSPREIRKTLEEDIASVPGIVGVNNHMGSRATADSRVMRTVLELLGEKGLFFIDSRTTPESVALDLARELGVPSVRRNVFLDNEPTAPAIDVQTDELLNLAEKNGWAIGIGHANSETAEALLRLAKKASERNIRWVSLESLVAYVNTGN